MNDVVGDMYQIIWVHAVTQQTPSYLWGRVKICKKGILRIGNNKFESAHHSLF